MLDSSPVLHPAGFQYSLRNVASEAGLASCPLRCVLCGPVSFAKLRGFQVRLAYLSQGESFKAMVTVCSACSQQAGMPRVSGPSDTALQTAPSLSSQLLEVVWRTLEAADLSEGQIMSHGHMPGFLWLSEVSRSIQQQLAYLLLSGASDVAGFLTSDSRPLLFLLTSSFTDQ